MKQLYRAISVFAVILPVFLLIACPGGGGPATITLSGDVACTQPVTVTGTVTTVGTDLHISATVKCAGVGVAGVTLNGTLPVATGNIQTSWGPTDSNGTATTTLDISSVAIVPARFHVIVKDNDGNVVKDEPITIQ